MVAISTRSSEPMVARTSSSELAMAAIAPPAGSSLMTRARVATRVAASSSDSTPATCAAASAPTECPISSCGVTPQLSHSRKVATSTANRAGWVQRVSSSSRADSLSAGANMTSRSEPSVITRSNAAKISSNAAAATGDAAASRAPIPACWLPWPGNRKAVRPRNTVPVTTSGCGRDAASARVPSTSSSRSAPRTTARCS
uniref:Uncharacterized protein n=1 Tax=Nocardia terpenica TaxID=455432 RepID=A0A809QV70_9NOCA|nr:hypothetical protein [Nocardia terpenica]